MASSRRRKRSTIAKIASFLVRGGREDFSLAFRRPGARVMHRIDMDTNVAPERRVRDEENARIQARRAPAARHVPGKSASRGNPKTRRAEYPRD